MKTLLVNIFLIFHFAFTSTDPMSCSYKFYAGCEGWLKFHEMPTSWNEARLTCYYEGAQLASPTSNLLNAMTNIIKENNIASGKVFTGINTSFFTKRFSTIEGIPLSSIPHKWAEGEPNNSKNPENCIALNQYGTLVDLQCDQMHPFICYKKNEDLNLNECGSFDNEYVLDNRTGSCYKFHRYPHTWPRSQMICEAEGGHLAIINSETEAQVMRDIFARNPGNTLPPHAPEISASIGFRDIDERSEWVTIHGQTLKEAGYDKFGQGQPDNYGGQQFCGNVFRSGLLDDVACDINIPFICEKDPNTLTFCIQ